MMEFQKSNRTSLVLSMHLLRLLVLNRHSTRDYIHAIPQHIRNNQAGHLAGAAKLKPPPFTRSKCFRTVFISSIVAPHRSKACDFLQVNQ